METMDLETKRGEKVIFSYPNNGYEFDKVEAQKYLKLGEEYTVDCIHIDSWVTYVYLKEIRDVAFNSTHFTNKVVSD